MDYGTSLQICYCTVERAAGNAAVICHGVAECAAGDFSMIFYRVVLKCAAGQLAVVSDARNAQTDVARMLSRSIAPVTVTAPFTSHSKMANLPARMVALSPTVTSA